MNLLLILLGKLLSAFSRLLNLGSGSTWPGHIALSINTNFIKQILKHNPKLKIILIAGTNGKTTTAKLIRTILKKNNYRVFQNEGGANLLNGIASSMLLHSNVLCTLNYDYTIFEIDENTLPLILKEIADPNFIILLNLFRDQLDRYGEINTIASKWREALKKLNSATTLILNADDPQITYLGLHLKGATVKYFGINPANGINKAQHASDSTYCPNCGRKLAYDSAYFSHLGNWHCDNCGLKHPQKTFTSSPIYPLFGDYNKYNTNAAVLLAKEIGFSNEKIISSLKDFKPAFGRQEILNVYGKKIQIFLSKNPTSLNESLKTIVRLNAKNLLLVLNDRIPDGRDVSWIWDADTEEYISKFKNILISGDRAFDMALRLKYSSKAQNSNVKSQNYSSKFKIIENLEEAVFDALIATLKDEILYILPTYSAMLDVRKILTGKKIL
ncbi:MAG: hypothetical protein A3E12_00065 [Candidatus Levybacteria bacterium RIFCSPHIGHO2_12_FULL_39_9]|nr:MAG: hypothetical protein A3E12_00065 [Candidatus Levybacteria bacterium RIFCSPHIGHO2_12_FULL_39_9]